MSHPTLIRPARIERPAPRRAPLRGRVSLGRQARLLARLLVPAAVLCWRGLAAGQALGPPLSEWFPVTSTFCEYRTQHFHAGIDLATGGRTGLPVLAVSRGQVSRVRVSGAGYGKAVNLLLDNGMTAVYGHLDRFSDKIESFVLAKQLESGEYEQDLVPPPGSIRVEEGEAIGLSGDTGASSGPHLHFELKRGGTALNPLKSAYCLTDAVRPTFNYVRLVPVGPESEIDGAGAPCVIRPGGGRRGVWESGRLPRVTGSFYVSASVFDRTGGASNRLAVYQTRLFLDDSLVFETRFDEVDEARTNEVELAYDLGLARRGDRFTLNLRRFDGARLRGLEWLGPRTGIIDVERSGLRGQHTLRVEATDAAGNQSSVKVRFLAGSRPRVESVAFARNGGALDVEARVRNGGSRTTTQDERVWLKSELSGASGSTPASLMSRVTSEEAASDGLESYSCRVSLPASTADRLEYPAGVIKVWVEDKDGFDSAPFTAWLPGRGGAAGASADLEVERHKDFAEILASVTPHYLRPRIGVVASDTVWLDVTEQEEGRYRAAFRFSHLFSEGGTAVCVVPVGASAALTRSRPVVLGLARKDTAGIVRNAEGDAAFKYEADTFYGDTYLSFDRKPGGDLPAGLRFESDVFSLEPGDVVFDKRGSVVITCEDGAAASGKVAVYRRESGSRWSYAGAIADTLSNTIGAQVRALCDYALIRDELPPNIFGLRPRAGRLVAGRTPLIHAYVRDVGSGVEWQGMTVTIDGRKVLSVWDPRYSRLSVVHTCPLEPGRHRVVFQARDRCGNLRVAETSFSVSR